MKAIRRLRSRGGRRFRNHRKCDNLACQEILRDVWSITWDYAPVYTGVPPDPYLIHWETCVNGAKEFASDQDLLLSDRKVAAHLVKLLKCRLDETPATIQEFIRSNYSVATTTTTTASVQLTVEQAQAALVFATNLWLHVKPELTSATRSMRAVVKDCVPPRTDPAAITGILSADFCAKHLARKGGFSIVKTDRLERHLNSYKGTIEVFCNSSMLSAMQQDPRTDPFPPEFVAETLKTICLLFRPLDDDKSRWNTHYKEKHRVDLEFGLAGYPILDLHHYPYWHERLAEIQRLYKEATPSSVAQWWFDRRDRVQWATFWVAFVVLTLTIVFGVISSVTGILQVYAIYHPPS